MKDVFNKKLMKGDMIHAVGGKIAEGPIYLI